MNIQPQEKSRWTKTLIRQARKTDLAPILINRGYRLQPLKNNNYQVRSDQNGKSFAGLVIKNNYWICYDNNSAGNSIDFFMKIESLSFHQAMNVIIGHDYDASERNPPWPAVASKRRGLQNTVIARL